MLTTSSHRFTRAVAGALVITALAAPAADARPVTGFGDDSSSVPTPAGESRSETPAPTITRTIDEGFGWGSAAIGAGGATAVLLLGAAGASALSNRQGRVVVR